MTPRHTIRFDAEGYASCEEHNWTSTEPGDVALSELAEHTDHADEDATRKWELRDMADHPPHHRIPRGGSWVLASKGIDVGTVHKVPEGFQATRTWPWDGFPAPQRTVPLGVFETRDDALEAIRIAVLADDRPAE